MTNFDFDKDGANRPQDIPVDTGAETVEAKPVVRASAFGSETVEVPFVEEDGYKDVQYYLDEAKLLPGPIARHRKRYTLNGETATLGTKVTAPGAVIVVTNKVRNG